MDKKDDNIIRIPFSIKRFLASGIGHFVLFSSIIGMAYLFDPQMLAYDFLFTACAIAGVMMGTYHGMYLRVEE